MFATSDLIRIQVRHNEPIQELQKGSPRDQFWAVFKRQEKYGQRSIASLEAELTRQFGPNLLGAMGNRIVLGLHEAERALYGSEMEQMLQEYRHFFHFQHSKDWPTFYPYDPLSRLIEFRQRVFQDVPAARAAFERIVTLSSVAFTVQIAGYSSLNLSLAVGQISKLAQAFDSDFDSFRVFLDAFVPEAFEEVFDSETTNLLSFDIDISSSFKSSFVKAPRLPVTSTCQAPDTEMGAQQKPQSMQRAEWLWKLANGSLLIPVLLALIVLYFGFKELAAIRTAQYEAFKPILEHHLFLLKEDRERLYPQTPAIPPPANSPQAKP